MRKLIVLLWLGCAAIATAAENNIPKHGPLTAASGDRVIAFLVNKLLEETHYLQRPFDDEISSRFLDRYINLLDPQHLHFLKSDLVDFEPYRFKLDDKIKKDRDTSAAYEIANRFIERVEERMAYCQDLLKNEKFEFNTNEKVLIDRKDAAFPKDLEEAKRLWRDRLRAEVLQEVMNQIKPPAQSASLEGQPLPLRSGAVGWTDGTTIFVDVPVSVSGRMPTIEPERSMTLQFGSGYVTNITNFVVTGVSPGALGLSGDSNAVFNVQSLNAEQSNKVANFVFSMKSNWVVKATESGVTSTNKTEPPVEIVSRRYNRILRIYREWDNEDALEVFLTSLARSFDPHSDYMGKSTLDNFAIGMSLSLFGIGARLTSEDGYCTIVELTDGGPAKRGGKLKPKDKIVGVAQGDSECVDVVDMKLNKIVEMIRGPKGTEVRLTVIPVDAPSPSTRKVISLVREEIKLEDQEAKAKLMELPGEDGKTVRLGLIDLPTFYHTFDVRTRGRSEESDSEPHTVKSTSVDVAKLLHKLSEEHVQGVILDLRRNGGGSLEEAIKLTGLFIKSGPVVQVRDPGTNGAITVEGDTDEEIVYDGPLLVLTSHFSASASEIFAGALQDYGRAVIVGDSSTHGKGTVQALHQLDLYVRMLPRPMAALVTNNPGALKFTIRKFYRATGSSTQLKGVKPDVILPSVVDAIELGESSLDNPLEWDTVKPADFIPANVVTQFLSELQQRSGRRVASEKDFAYIHEDYELMRKTREEKTVSLSLAERLKEKQDTEKRKRDRQVERATRPKSSESDYEITLKLADQPGLPDPIGKTNEVKLAQAPGGTPAATDSNHVALAANKAAPSNLEADEEDDATLAVDVPLEEAKHVLLDYLSLLAVKRDAMVQIPVQH